MCIFSSTLLPLAVASFTLFYRRRRPTLHSRYLFPPSPSLALKVFAKNRKCASSFGHPKWNIVWVAWDEGSNIRIGSISRIRVYCVNMLARMHHQRFEKWYSICPPLNVTSFLFSSSVNTHLPITLLLLVMDLTFH